MRPRFLLDHRIVGQDQHLEALVVAELVEGRLAAYHLFRKSQCNGTLELNNAAFRVAKREVGQGGKEARIRVIR